MYVGSWCACFCGGGGYMGVHMCKVCVFQSVWGDLYMWVGI